MESARVSGGGGGGGGGEREGWSGGGGVEGVGGREEARRVGQAEPHSGPWHPPQLPQQRVEEAPAVSFACLSESKKGGGGKDPKTVR